MVRTRPVHLKPRVPLVSREPRADLDEYLGPAAAPHVDFNSNLIAIKANPDLVPFLLSEVEKNLGFSCQLAATDQMDPAFLGDVYHAGRKMEDFLDKADSVLWYLHFVHSCASIYEYSFCHNLVVTI